MSDYKENENDLTNDRDLNENNMTIFLSSPEDEDFEPDEEQTSSGSKIRIAINLNSCGSCRLCHKESVL